MKIIIDPGLDERLKSGYYFQEFDCVNCDDPRGIGLHGGIDVMIPKGERRPEKLKCPNCGLFTLK